MLNDKERMQLLLDTFNGGKPTAVSMMDIPAVAPLGYPKPPLERVGAVSAPQPREGFEPETYHHRMVNIEFDQFKKTFVSLFPLIQYVRAHQLDPALSKQHLYPDILHSIARCMVEVYPLDNKFGDCTAPFRGILKNWIVQDIANHQLLTQAAYLTFLALMARARDCDDAKMYRLADKAGRAVFDLFVHEYVISHVHMLGLTSVECLSQMSWEQENFYVQTINTAWEWIRDHDKFAVNVVMDEEDKKQFIAIEPAVSAQTLEQAGVAIQEMAQSGYLEEFVNAQASELKPNGRYILYGVQVNTIPKPATIPTTGAPMQPNMHFQSHAQGNVAAPHGYNPAPAPMQNIHHAWGNPMHNPVPQRPQQEMNPLFSQMGLRPAGMAPAPMNQGPVQGPHQQPVSFLLDASRQQYFAMDPAHIQLAQQYAQQGGIFYGIAGEQLVPIQLLGHEAPNQRNNFVAKWIVSSQVQLGLPGHPAPQVSIPQVFPGQQPQQQFQHHQFGHPQVQDVRSMTMPAPAQNQKPLFTPVNQVQEAIDPRLFHSDAPGEVSPEEDYARRTVPEHMMPKHLRGRGYRMYFTRGQIEERRKQIAEEKKKEQEAQQVAAQVPVNRPMLVAPQQPMQRPQSLSVAPPERDEVREMFVQGQMEIMQKSISKVPEAPQKYTPILTSRASQDPFNKLLDATTMTTMKKAEKEKADAITSPKPAPVAAPAPAPAPANPYHVKLEKKKERHTNYTYPLADELSDKVLVVPAANPFENMEVVELGEDDKAIAAYLEALTPQECAKYAASKLDYKPHHEADIVESLSQFDDEGIVLMPGTPEVHHFEINPQDEDEQGMVSDLPWTEPKQVAEAVIVASVLSDDEAWLLSDTRLYTQSPWNDEPSEGHDEGKEKPHEAIMVATNRMTPILADHDAAPFMESLLKHRTFDAMASALNREYSNIINKTERRSLSKERVWTLKIVSFIDNLFTKEVNRLLKKRFGLTLSIDRFSEDGHELVSYLEEYHGEKFAMAMREMESVVIDAILTGNPDEKGTTDLTNFYYSDSFLGLPASNTPVVSYVSRRNLYVSLRATHTYLGVTLDRNGVGRALVRNVDNGIIGSDVLNALIRQLDIYFEGQDFNDYENIFVRTLDGRVVSLSKSLVKKKTWMIALED